MTRRLAMLRMLGLLPATRYGTMGQAHRRPDQQTDPPPSAVAPSQAAGTLRARRVIISGTGNGIGLFEYSGTPALGNPPVAYAAAPGITKDPFGNTLPSSNGGFTAVSAGISIVNMTQGSIGLNSLNASTKILATGGGGVQLIDTTVTSGQPATQLFGPATNVTDITGAVVALGQSQDTTKPAQVLIDANGLGPHTPTTTALLEVQGAIQTTGLNNVTSGNNVIAAGGLQASLGDVLVSSGNVNITTAAKGVVRTGETWHVVGAASQPPFVNSFTAGGTSPRFQVEAVGAGRVRLSGSVNTGAVTGANTTMFTLPAGYVPARQFGFVTANNVTAYALGSASVQVTTGGAVQLVPAGTAGKFVLLDGICFELD